MENNNEKLDKITKDERINLKKLINSSDCEDNTEYIKKIKHSSLIAQDIHLMKRLKEEHSSLKDKNLEEYLEIFRIKCIFLYKNYTDIFNRILKDELDLNIMSKLLFVLKMIEDGKVDQHEGSVHVGKILKELYVDSALKQSSNLELKNPKIEPDSGKKVSWKEFKQMSV